MRYLLVVGFACDVYHREPRARLFFNDHLIDEFCIKQHKDTFTPAVKTFLELSLQPFKRIELVKMQVKNYPPLRFYEIELDKKLECMEIKIEIKNSDSNYTNGFMTKSTLLKLQVGFFFPLDDRLLSRLIKIRKKNFIYKNYAWYRTDKNIIFDLISNGMIWKGKDKKISNSNITEQCNIGGDGYFYCKFVKKYGIFIAKLSKSYRYICFNNVKTNYFIDKYQQHAHQRDSN